MTRKLLVLSGGLDSMVMAYEARKQSKDTVRAIYYDFGRPSRHHELTSVKYTCHALEIPLEHVNAISIQDSIAGLVNDVRFESGDSPDPDPIDIHLQTDRPTGFPIVAEMAAYYAALTNYDEINFGVLKGQFYGGAKEYLESADLARKKINSNVSQLPTSRAPFGDKDKHEVVALGNEGNVPMHLSWSCFVGGEVHCGKCEGCVDRQDAFREAGVDDLTEYEA